MKYNNKILEAINRGIKLALDDYEENITEPISSKSDIIKGEESIKKLIEFNKLFVDLGLPSGTLWAKYNLGCDWHKLINDPSHSKPNEWYGNYYAWGETLPKETYSWDTYEGYGSHSKYADNFDNTVNDNDNKTDVHTILLPENDAAYLANYRMKMPTKELFVELLNYTINEWIKNYLRIKGLNGRLFTSKINGELIFIPASGDKYQDLFNDGGYSCYLWSSSLNVDNHDNAWYLYFNSGYIFIDYYHRCNGFAVRPVYN